MNNSVVNFGDLSKPINTLIEKISDAIGHIAKPSQIVRLAKAESRAAIISAQGKFEIQEIEKRAKYRTFQEQIIIQSNIENITEKATTRIKHDARPEDIDNDWLAFFFGKCKIVSNDEMQVLWSSILAGEANAPGAFSRKTLETISVIEKKDAEDFLKICGFVCDVGSLVPLIYDLGEEFYIKKGITFDLIRNLSDLGLIIYRFGAFDGGYAEELDSDSLTLKYCGRIYNIIPSVDPISGLKKLDFPIGGVLFTNAGRELYKACKQPFYEDFEEYFLKRLNDEDHKVVPTRNF